MKRLNKLNFDKTKLLSRDQLKNITGGSGGGGPHPVPGKCNTGPCGPMGAQGKCGMNPQGNCVCRSAAYPEGVIDGDCRDH